MDKFLKIIKSRFFISALVILLEFIQLLIVFMIFNHYFMVITILGYFFYVGVFLYIINKYKSPEFKLPWVIILMLFFVYGAFVFILLTGNEESKKTVAKFQKNKEELKPYLKDNTLDKLKLENKHAYLQANYIKETTGLPPYENTKVTYYKIGEEFFSDLLKTLNLAKNFIFMEYFIIEEGKMWNSIYEILKAKVDSGVKVYVIYDDFGCMTTIDEKYYKKLNAEGINCIPYNLFKPVLSNFHNNRDHRKITVIDNKIGFTGGINLADEYINAKIKHGHWKDTAVKLEGEAVKSLTALFLEAWNTQNKKEIDIHEFMKLETKNNNSNGIAIPYGDGPEDYYQNNVAKQIYINMLNAATDYVYITSPYLICDYEMLNAIAACAKKGVDVRLITPHIPDKKTVQLMTRSNYEVLVNNGVKIYEYSPGFMHAKMFICDDLYATCGSVNLDYRSLVHHFECGVWMYKADCIKDMKSDFLETLKFSEEVTKENVKLKGLKKLTAEVLKVYSPLL